MSIQREERSFDGSPKEHQQLKHERKRGMTETRGIRRNQGQIKKGRSETIRKGDVASSVRSCLSTICMRTHCFNNKELFDDLAVVCGWARWGE